MSSYQPKLRHRVEKKSYICAKCGKVLTPQEACFYVDGCNCAITQSAKPLCAECYVKSYGRIL